MRVKYITVASHTNEYLTALIQSRPDIHVIECTWRGFGTKVIETVNYLKTLDGYTHFVFVDAYDTLFQSEITGYKGGIVFSTEKHKWPDRDAPYKDNGKVWQYLNSGAYIAPIKEFLELIEKHPINYEDDDQRYFTNIFLQGGIELDYDCKIFQSMAFETAGDFTISDRVRNNITGTTPAILHFNGKCHDKRIYNMTKFNTLKSVQDFWKDTPEVHKEIHEAFIERVNSSPELKAHRDFVEQNIFGFGERSFLWMWKLIIDAILDKFTFLEIGVFKGQTLSLIELLAPGKSKRYGITPLSTEGGVWDSDYETDIKLIHDTFGLAKDYKIIKGLSEDADIIKQASKLSLDILYIDGGHEERHIRNDIVNYQHLVKPGGFMVIDDCCNSFHMPFGYFQGIDSVTKVVDELLPPHAGSSEWEFLFSVVHNRVYRRA